MNEKIIFDKLCKIIEKYEIMVRQEMDCRWQNWEIDLSINEMYEVIGALMARQITLACELASAPSIWNAHVAPVILRSMADCYITLAWIFRNPQERSRKFIEYGLGQKKLEIEHRKAQIISDGKNAEEDLVVKTGEAWLNSQKYDFLTEVDIGNWSGITVRKMAEEADIVAFYNYVYNPFSAATHNMWHHVCRYNLAICTNPLHKYHRIPSTEPKEADMHYLYLAGKYANKVFKLFDKETKVKVDTPSAFEELAKSLEILQREISETHKE